MQVSHEIKAELYDCVQEEGLNNGTNSNKQSSQLTNDNDEESQQEINSSSMRQQRRKPVDDRRSSDPEMVDTNERPSNEKLLSVAFLSFTIFALVQTGAAFIAGSEAMIGDSAAMMVDSLTYLFNWVAERRKQQNPDVSFEGDDDPERCRRLQIRSKRKQVLQLELVPPLISVTTLLAVTAVVLHKSIRVLILDMHRDPSLQSDPNLNLMLFFSILNLFLDIGNVCFFAKAQHLLGFSTVEEDHAESEIQNYAQVDIELNDMAPPGSNPNTARTSFGSESSDEVESTNLNMCSAYTHVFADTLRSIAVIIAASIAEISDGVTPEAADATAAVVVSALILASLVPLFRGMVTSFGELRAIQAEERSDQMFSRGSSAEPEAHYELT